MRPARGVLDDGQIPVVCCPTFCCRGSGDRRALASFAGAVVIMLVIVAAAPVAAGPSRPEAVKMADYVTELDQWHAQRIERLTGPDGWLTVVGLFWLEDGKSSVGTDVENDVVLPTAAGYARAATLQLSGGTITVHPIKGVPLRLNDEPLRDRAVIASDAEGPPDVLTLGEIRFFVLERGGSYAIRIKNPGSAERAGFHGVDRFPINRRLRVEATLEPYEPWRKKNVPTVIGTQTSYLVPGLLRFEIGGVECTLEPVLADEEAARLFIIFGDATNGVETYGAGRFLYAEREQDGKVILDFNRAINPPCAFTRFATCPLPPPQNRLSVEIRAGEMRYGDH